MGKVSVSGNADFHWREVNEVLVVKGNCSWRRNKSGRVAAMIHDNHQQRPMETPTSQSGESGGGIDGRGDQEDMKTDAADAVPSKDAKNGDVPKSHAPLRKWYPRHNLVIEAAYCDRGDWRRAVYPVLLRMGMFDGWPCSECRKKGEPQAQNRQTTNVRQDFSQSHSHTQWAATIAKTAAPIPCSFGPLPRDEHTPSSRDRAPVVGKGC